MASKKQLMKEARKELLDEQRIKPDVMKKKKSNYFKERMEFIKRVAEMDTKEYEDIDEDELYPLTLAAKYLPIKDIKDGIIETKDGRFLKILEIEPVNFELKTVEEQDKIIQKFEEYLRAAPSNLQIKCISQETSMDKYLEEIDRHRMMEKNKENHIFYEDHKDFVCRVAENDAISRKFYFIYQYESTYRNSRNKEEAKRKLDSIAEDAIDYFKRCGNYVCDINDKPTHTQASIIYEILNREKARNIPLEINIVNVDEKWAQVNGEETLDRIDIREYLSPQRIDFKNPDCVVVDGTYYTHIMIKSNGYHSRITNAWTSILTNMGEGIDVDFFIRKEDSDDLKNRIARHNRFNRLRLQDKNPTNETRFDFEDNIDAGKYLLDGLYENQEFYYVNTMITVTAQSKEILNWKVDKVREFLKIKEYQYSMCKHKQEDAFCAYMPFLNLDNQLFRMSKQNVLTSDLAMFYPFTAYELNTRKGVMFGISRNKSIVTLDNFDTHLYSNANIAIMGTSGAGKTYTLQTIASRQRMNHIPVTIIAPLKGTEFKRLCNAWNGSFISMSPSSSNCINIMEIRKRDTRASKYIDGDDSEASLLVEKTQNLLIFFSLLVPDITYEEKQLVDDAIMKTYQSFGITEDNSSIYDIYGRVKTMPILGDLHAVLDENPETKRIANILRRLVSGSARSFNQHTNVDLDNEYTVIDISELKGDMLIIGMFIALDYVWSKAKEDRTKKKTIIIDELWKLIGSSSNELAAEYVLEIFKTIRGYRGSAIGATQDLVDFYALKNGKYGKGIINNCNIKLVLKLEDKEARAVQDSMDLTEGELKEIVGFERGQAMLVANHNNIIVNVKASKHEHYLITTDGEDLERIAREKELQYAY